MPVKTKKHAHTLDREFGFMYPWTQCYHIIPIFQSGCRGSEPGRHTRPRLRDTPWNAGNVPLWFPALGWWKVGTVTVNIRTLTLTPHCKHTPFGKREGEGDKEGDRDRQTERQTERQRDREGIVHIFTLGWRQHKTLFGNTWHSISGSRYISL